MLFDASSVTSQTITVGVTLQPFSIPFLITKTPNCAQTPTFTMTSNVLAPFVNLSAAGDGGNNVVNAAQSDNGTYILTVDADLDIASAQETVTLTIVDPCQLSTIKTIPAVLADFFVVMPSALTQTQKYQISTDYELFPYPVVCVETATLTPAAAFVGLSPDFETITVDETQIVLPTDVGTHLFTVKIKNSKFLPPTVAELSVPVKVKIDCFVNSFNVMSKPADQTVILNQGVF